MFDLSVERLDSEPEIKMDLCLGIGFPFDVSRNDLNQILNILNFGERALNQCVLPFGRPVDQSNERFHQTFLEKLRADSSAKTFIFISHGIRITEGKWNRRRAPLPVTANP